MTVAEAIEKLKHMPPQAEIMEYCDEFGMFTTAEDVRMIQVFWARNHILDDTRWITKQDSGYGHDVYKEKSIVTFGRKSFLDRCEEQRED